MAPIIKLIADSGSTKTQWAVLDGGHPRIFQSQGMSPYFLDGDGLASVIRQEVLPALHGLQVDEIFFYGTGCKDKANAALVDSVFREYFPLTQIRVDNDLFGAARALCGREQGIACILGTGSNSCYFDGESIVKTAPDWGTFWEMKEAVLFWGKKLFSIICTIFSKMRCVRSSMKNSQHR